MLKKRFNELSLTAEDKAEIKKLYNEYHETEIGELSLDIYLEFKRTGKRIGYETLYFNRRRRLSGTLMMCKAYGDEYLRELSDLITAICGEYAWALPAHTANSQNPREEIDLFAAETAMTLTEIAYILGDALPERICERIAHEVQSRVISVFENRKFHWETADHNWAAVCGGCIGMVYLYRNHPVPERVMKAVECYLDGINKDGACLEGGVYWSYGFGYYMYFAVLLKARTGIDIADSEKVKRLAQFQQNIYLGKALANFSDCAPDTAPLAGFTGMLCEMYPGTVYAPAAAPDRNDDCGRWAPYIRSFLYTPVQTGAGEGETVYSDSQLYISKRKKFSFFIKGGSNTEPHNHNDVGSFIISDNEKQLLCDLGSGEYAGDYFDDRTRYNYLCCSSLGHNVPVIDGAGQSVGADYACDAFECGNDRAYLSIGGAYGKGITITRQTEIKNEGIILTDSFKADDGAEHKVTERFISRIKPVVTGNETRIEKLRIDHAFKVFETLFRNHKGEDETVYILECDIKGGEFKAEMVIMKDREGVI